jgi:hypothetical protein
MTRTTDNIEPLLETVLELQQERHPELSGDVVRRLLEMHADPAMDERSRFRAVRDLIETEAAE